MTDCSERGGVGLFVAATGALVVLVAASIIGAVVDLGVTAARARTAADAAALAGAGASPLVGGDGEVCASARVVASANGATLETCVTRPTTRAAEPLRVEVSTRVPTSLPLLRPFVEDLTAPAAAAVRLSDEH